MLKKYSETGISQGNDVHIDLNVCSGQTHLRLTLNLKAFQCINVNNTVEFLLHGGESFQKIY